MPEARRGEDRVHGPAGVREGVVGHHPLDFDAQAGKPAEGAREEGGTGGAVLGRQDLGMSEPRSIIHSDVQVVRPQAAGAVGLRGIAVDPVADGHEAWQGLEIDMEELARSLPLVARTEPIAPRLLEAAQAGVVQEPADGRHRELELSGDLRARQTPGGPQADDAPHHPVGRTPGRAVRPRGAIDEPGRSLGEKPAAPFVEGAGADVQGRGDQGDGLPVLDEPPDRFGSPPDGQPGILMGVH